METHPTEAAESLLFVLSWLRLTPAEKPRDTAATHASEKRNLVMPVNDAVLEEAESLTLGDRTSPGERISRTI